MRYERRKELSAALSLLSVAIAIAAAAMSGAYLTNTGAGGGLFDAALLGILTAAAIAAVAATMSIRVSRRLAAARASKQIFLIYAHQDREAAQNLAARLREHGLDPWLDAERIAPGQVWEKSVMRGLEESAAALVLTSGHLAKDRFAQQELEAALETLQARQRDMSPVIPVRIDDPEVPERLSHITWASLSDEQSLQRLLDGLTRTAA